MTHLVLALACLGQGPSPDSLANPVYRAVLDEGLVVEGVTVKLPPPCLRDGMLEAEARAALKGAVDLPLEEFLRDSVNAPFKLKVRDVPYPSGVVRVIDLWFAVHANLDEIDLDEMAGSQDQAGKEVAREVGNMSFSARTLTGPELKSRSKVVGSGLDRYAFSRGVLLDKVEVSAVNHILASQAGGVLMMASKTDSSFDQDPEFANRWLPVLAAGDSKKDPGPPRSYAGSAGYSRIGRISEGTPGPLLVESHLAFAEPKAWFNGASILRSKIGLVAQDQIRQLRREVATRRKKK